MYSVTRFKLRIIREQKQVEYNLMPNEFHPK